MQSLPPTEAAEPTLPHASGSGALRTTTYGLLVLLLLAGAWVRFNREVAAVAPGLAGPAADVATQAAAAGREAGLVEVGLLPASATATAVAAMGLPAGDAAALTQAVRDRRLRLVRLPLFDSGPFAAAGRESIHAVQVSSGGYTRVVELTEQPVSVTLPIGPVGTVAMRNLSGEAVGIGALTLAGPVRLPDLAASGTLEVGVIAQ